jgi:hypothetical protein
MSTKMFDECWKRIEIETGVFKGDWDEATRMRVNGMLRKGGVASFGADRFHKAMRDAISEQWELKHGTCHDHCTCDCDHCECDGTCDGSCGHDRDECDGCSQYIDTDKALLDLVGCATHLLNGDDRFGRNRGNWCPNAVYEDTYAA